MSYSLHVPPEVIAAIREEFKLHVVRYGWTRFPLQPGGTGPNGRPLCTGCHQEVPKYRRSWCSDKCYDRYVPQRVSYAVRQRDKGICQGCGGNIAEMAKARKGTEPKFDYWGAREKYKDRPHWESPEWKEYQKLAKIWRQGKIVEEYDHIIPFSEGGLTILENMRTLCSPCHKTRTRQWHAERKLKKAA